MKDLQNKATISIIALLLGIMLSGTLLGQDSIVQIPRIKNICVNTGNVIIEWEKSTTPGVLYYTIYYKYIGLNPNPDWKELQGIQIPAADPSDYSFSPALIAEVDVTSEPVAFAVQAHTDSIESLVDDRFWTKKWDSTMYLQGNFDMCYASVELDWTPYDFNMWDYSTSEYRVYISENGATPELNAVVPPGQTNLSVTNLLANSNYDIYVAAIPSNGITSDSSTSTTLRINTDMAILPDYMYADYATCNDNNIDIRFSVDPDSELEKYRILRSNTVNGAYDTVYEVNQDSEVISFTDKTDYLSGPYYYKLIAINSCDVIIRESQNTASSIVLSNAGEVIRPELNWNSYENWLNGVSEYILERQIGNDDYEVIANLNTTSFIDEDLSMQQGNGMGASVCYRVTALENNNVNGNNAKSLSNTICIELPVNIRFDYDAFTPGNSFGNNSFGPTIDYIPDIFEFKVLDRSGKIMFETSDARNSRWNGRCNGQLVPQGAYMYVLQYQLRGGKKHTLRGGVVVVYND